MNVKGKYQCSKLLYILYLDIYYHVKNKHIEVTKNILAVCSYLMLGFTCI